MSGRMLLNTRKAKTNTQFFRFAVSIFFVCTDKKKISIKSQKEPKLKFKPNLEIIRWNYSMKIRIRKGSTTYLWFGLLCALFILRGYKNEAKNMLLGFFLESSRILFAVLNTFQMFRFLFVRHKNDLNTLIISTLKQNAVAFGVTNEKHKWMFCMEFWNRHLSHNSITCETSRYRIL